MPVLDVVWYIPHDSARQTACPLKCTEQYQKPRAALCQELVHSLSNGSSMHSGSSSHSQEYRGMRANKMITDRVALKVEINVSTVQALCIINANANAGVMHCSSFVASTASTGAMVELE